MKTYHHSLIDQYEKYSRILPERSVLVVGCNTGLECDLIRERGCKNIYGLDVVNKTGQLYRHDTIKYFRASAQDMPFKNEQFNSVVSFASLEHIPDPLRAMQEMIRVTKKNGIIFCQAAPLWYDPYGHHKRPVFPDDPWVHVRYPSVEKMKAFYSDRLDQKVEGYALSGHINYVWSDHFNRLKVSDYKKILMQVLPTVSPVNVHFSMKFDHLKLMNDTIRHELSLESEENLLTSSLLWVFRKL